MSRLGIMACIVGAWVALATGAAHAQDYDGAGRLFTAAQDAFAKQHYQTAAVRFQAAYDITKDPLLLYNIGESWQKGGDGKKAVAAFRAYLKAAPEAKDKGEVERRIQAIEAATKKKGALVSQSAPGDDPKTALDGLTGAPAAAAAPEAAPANPATATTPTNAAAPAPPAAPAPEAAPATPAPAAADKPTTEQAPAAPPAAAKPEPAPELAKPAPGLLDEKPASKLRIAAWIGVATTVAVLTAGAILGLAAQSRADEITRRLNFVDSNGQPRVFDAMQQSEFKNLTDEGKLYEGLSIGFFAISGAVAVATAVLFGLDYARGKKKSERAFRFAPAGGPGRAGLATGWSF